MSSSQEERIRRLASRGDQHAQARLVPILARQNDWDPIIEIAQDAHLGLSESLFQSLMAVAIRVRRRDLWNAIEVAAGIVDDLEPVAAEWLSNWEYGYFDAWGITRFFEEYGFVPGDPSYASALAAMEAAAYEWLDGFEPVDPAQPMPSVIAVLESLAEGWSQASIPTWTTWSDRQGCDAMGQAHAANEELRLWLESPLAERAREILVAKHHSLQGIRESAQGYEQVLEDLGVAGGDELGHGAEEEAIWLIDEIIDTINAFRPPVAWYGWEDGSLAWHPVLDHD